MSDRDDKLHRFLTIEKTAQRLDREVQDLRKIVNDSGNERLMTRMAKLEIALEELQLDAIRDRESELESRVMRRITESEQKIIAMLKEKE